MHGRRLGGAMVVAVLTVGCQPVAEVCGGATDSRPTPDTTCTAQVVGAVACPEPGAGWGYSCTSAGCWQLEPAGVCTTDGGLPDGGLPDGGLPDGGLPDGGLPDGGLPDGGLPDGGLPDGGLPDAGSCAVAWRCANEGSTECRAGTSYRCTGGCFVAQGACTDGGLLCPGSEGTPLGVDGPCTTTLVGRSICPSGLTGAGLECTSAGCWSLFHDGACAVPRADAGACASSCQLDAGDQCQAGVRSRCIQSSFSTPCWVDVGVCP